MLQSKCCYSSVWLAILPSDTLCVIQFFPPESSMFEQTHLLKSTLQTYACAATKELHSFSLNYNFHDRQSCYKLNLVFRLKNLELKNQASKQTNKQFRLRADIFCERVGRIKHLPFNVCERERDKRIRQEEWMKKRWLKKRRDSWIDIMCIF